MLLSPTRFLWILRAQLSDFPSASFWIEFSLTDAVRSTLTDGYCPQEPSGWILIDLQVGNCRAAPPPRPVLHLPRDKAEATVLRLLPTYTSKHSRMDRLSFPSIAMHLSSYPCRRLRSRRFRVVAPPRAVPHPPLQGRPRLRPPRVLLRPPARGAPPGGQRLGDRPAPQLRLPHVPLPGEAPVLTPPAGVSIFGAVKTGPILTRPRQPGWQAPEHPPGLFEPAKVPGIVPRPHPGEPPPGAPDDQAPERRIQEGDGLQLRGAGIAT
jgi:hypothetical protein